MRYALYIDHYWLIVSGDTNWLIDDQVKNEAIYYVDF